jgi:hypothetical protein
MKDIFLVWRLLHLELFFFGRMGGGKSAEVYTRYTVVVEEKS